jgi:two-component system, LuxR family, response regulator FixJ
MPADPIIHVIDDDDAARQSLEFLLRSACMNVRSYPSALAFLDSLPTNGSGCIITDVRMPEISGLELIQRLRDADQHIPVIVMTGHGDVPLAVQAMKIGAADFLEKPFDDERMLAAVRSALRHLAQDAQRIAERTELHDRLATLSTREREVLEGLVAGNPNKTIAYDLNISPRTVEVYRANVMTKMRAGSLSELVRMALVAGLLHPGSDR